MSTGEPSRVRAAAGRSEEVARDLESELMGPRDPMNPDDPRNFDKDGNRIPDRLGQVWFEHLFREMRKGGLLSPTGSRPLPVPPPRRVPPTPEEEAAILESSRKQALCSRLNYLSRLAAHEKRKQRWAQALEERKRELARKARHERLLFEECRRSRWIWGFVAIAGMLILSAAQQRSRFFELVGIVGFFLGWFRWARAYARWPSATAPGSGLEAVSCQSSEPARRVERAPKPVRKPRKQGKPGKLLSLKPFLGSEHSRLLPEGVIFLCAYEVHAQLASGIEAAFLQTARKRWRWGWWLQRKNPSDVLWLVDVDDEELLSRLREGTIPRYCDALPSGKAVWQEDARDNAELFLETLIEARRGFCRPGDVKVEGLVAGDGFREIVARVKGRSDARAKAAEALRDAPIVATAVELGLNPRPSGTGKAAWIATCPGTSHALMIGGDTNTFGCGWCKVSGGQEELRAFVRSRGK